MKEGDITCIQFQVWPRPRYGKEYKPMVKFLKPDELLFGQYPFFKNPSSKVAYWRIKKLKQ